VDYLSQKKRKNPIKTGTSAVAQIKKTAAAQALVQKPLSPKGF
jgi:hypothetical protein